MVFIQLTHETRHTEVLVPVANILHAEEDAYGGGTYIKLVGCPDICVEETVEQIMKRINAVT